jgi:hypothetical protein
VEPLVWNKRSGNLVGGHQTRRSSTLSYFWMISGMTSRMGELGEINVSLANC